MSDNFNDLLLILNLPTDGSILISKVEVHEDTKFIQISTSPSPVFCPNCGCRMHSKGMYARTVNHPVLQDSFKLVLVVHQRKWKCTSCTTYLNESLPFLQPYRQSTTLTPLLILEALKDLNRSTASIARQFFVSDTHVHDIFTAYVDLPRLPLPEVMSIDEVFLDISSKEKYALVIMDFVSGEIVDILPSRWSSVTDNYFYHIPLEERKKVKFIVSDAYRYYLDYPKTYFPNAVSILDSFHVVKYLISLLNTYVNDVMKRYKERDKKKLEKKNHDLNRDDSSIADSNEVILLRSYRWVLLKNYDHINHSAKIHYHSKLKLHLDTFQIENMFLALDPNFFELRRLKELYVEFNQSSFHSDDEVHSALMALIQVYKASNLTPFKKFADYLKKYQGPILRSFVTSTVTRKQSQDHNELITRLSNGPMESFNRKPKDLKRNARGFSNFHYTRNRILWATRKRPAIRVVPKSNAMIHSFEGKPRGPYNKNKEHNNN